MGRGLKHSFCVQYSFGFTKSSFEVQFNKLFKRIKKKDKEVNIVVFGGSFIKNFKVFRVKDVLSILSAESGTFYHRNTSLGYLFCFSPKYYKHFSSVKKIILYNKIRVKSLNINFLEVLTTPELRKFIY